MAGEQLRQINELAKEAYTRLNGLQLQATGQNVGIMANVYALLEQIAELAKGGDENGVI